MSGCPWPELENMKIKRWDGGLKRGWEQVLEGFSVFCDVKELIDSVKLLITIGS